VKDGAGSLYGTASGGGAVGAGVVYKLTQATSGKWNPVVLHNFSSGKGGDSPWSPLLANRGSFFGTTLQGGVGCTTGCGIVYQVTP
jgi:uncharacterized repeat protein (TIGR03803 family)